MTVVERLLELDQTFFKRDNVASQYWEDIASQSARHTRRRTKGDKNPVIDSHRPHESTLVKDYRTENERQFTRWGFDLFLAKTARIIRQCITSDTSQSIALDEWLQEKPFVHLGKSMTVDEFTQDVILRLCLENPNQLLIAFPYDKTDRSRPPSQGSVNEELGILPKIIPSSDIRHLSDSCFSFFAGKVKVSEGDNKQAASLYYSCDPKNWYQHKPVLKDSKIVYETYVWYEHNTGINMVNFIPGEYSCSQDGDIPYLEPFIRSYYAMADAAMSAFSDEFIVNSRYSFPIPQIKPTQCDKCKGRGYGKTVHDICRPCGGSGTMLWPGPSGVLVDGDDEKDPIHDSKSDGLAIKWNSPPMGFAKEAYERAWNLFDRALNSIGLHLGSGAGAGSSADALRERKEDEQDKLLRIAASTAQCVDTLLYHIESLLVPNVDNRVKPKTIVPEKITLVDLSKLKEDAENALPQDKLAANQNYINKKYADDPVMKQAQRALICYTPYILASEETIRLNMAKGVCKEEDIIKSTWSAIAIQSIVDEHGSDLVEMSKKDIHKLMDKWFEEEGLIEKVDNELLEGFTAAEAKEINGSQINALVSLVKSVGEGVITEEAAEMILIRRFGFGVEDARAIVEPGNKSDVGEDNQPSNGAKSSLDDIIHGYLVGVISKEDAINQISNQTGRSIEDVDRILSNKTSAPKIKNSINSVISFLIDYYDINANVKFVDIDNLGETTIDGTGLVTILIDKNSSFNDKAITLAHEFEHARQFISGDLEISDNGVYWLGVKKMALDKYNNILTSRKQVDINKYELFEWEVAARDAEKLVKKYLNK